MLPAMGFLILFLAYPLGLGIWLSFTAQRSAASAIHRNREYEWLWDDAIFWLSVPHAAVHFVASALQIRDRLYLALLLNENMPFKAMLPRDGFDPLHRADRAVGAGVLVDLRFAILDHLVVAEAPRPDHQNINFLGDTTWARICVISSPNIWRGVPFVGDHAARGFRRCSLLYEAATLDGATRWQMFPPHHLSAADPIIAVVMSSRCCSPSRLPADLGDDGGGRSTPPT